MFEEICRKTGTIKIPTGEYADSVPVFEDHAVTYFTMTETYRNADGVQQSADHVYCKGYEQPDARGRIPDFKFFFSHFSFQSLIFF
ncbi:MAG: hypothetical protein IJS14_01665 [Lentisphaeria bacterium]|nr:hypothetical protein [Lentisphaeria bacterium]